MQPLHFVMLVVLAIWLGLFAYLWRLDARLRQAEERLASGPAADADEAPVAVLETRGAEPAADERG